jgi:8-oxo-dGTP diphosphatase
LKQNKLNIITYNINRMEIITSNDKQDFLINMEKVRHQVIPRTICMIFDEAGQLLLIKFSETKGKLAGFYDCPGGHIEKGEGVLECAIREIREETALEVKDVELRGVIHVTNFFGKNVMLFVVVSKAVNHDAKESDEGKPFWVDPKNLGALKVFDDLKLLIAEVAGSDRIFTAKSEFNDDGEMINWEVEKN